VPYLLRLESRFKLFGNKCSKRHVRTNIRYQNLGRGCIDFVTETGTHPSRILGQSTLTYLNQRLVEEFDKDIVFLSPFAYANGTDPGK
jgi:hypothetical protein